jgi:hypothetical protein
VQEVTTVFVWLKEKKLDKKKVMRSELADVWQGLLPRAMRLERAYDKDEWPARSSGLCKAWCPVITCSFNGKRDKL